MAIEVFNRYEHKYLLTKNTYDKVIDYIGNYMMYDKYSGNGIPYTISNIYYDTVDDYLIRSSLSKPEYKEKLRLRSYGIPCENSKVFLEIKKKLSGKVNKRRTELLLSEAYNFVEHRTKPSYKPYINAQVVCEIECFMEVYNVVSKLYLAYDRIAYFEKENSDLRISFDSNIRFRNYDLRLEKGDYGEKLLDENTYLMEIKVKASKPLWLVRMLSELEIHRTHFSKYGTVYKRILS